ncbi:MAG TPA: FHA domain-containing protein [Anaerolineales bacterium]|nr:FHA domain-containing protein [Anaerolineales bacterium]
MNAQYPHLLVAKEGPSAGKTYPLEGDETFIGREPSSTLQIDSPGVSRKHARLTFQNNQYLIEDLGSSNGTFVNGERISKPWPLKNGDIISIGRRIQLEYQVALPPVSATMIEGDLHLVGGTIIEEAPHQPLVPSQPEAAPAGAITPPPEPQMTMIGQEVSVSQDLTPPQLSVTIAGQAPKTYTLTNPRVTIGRLKDNEIVIDSRIVSRHHAYLDRVQDGYLLSVIPEAGNPVLFDGRPLTASHNLHHGDILRIGSLDPGMMVTMTYVDPSHAAETQATPIRFSEKNMIQIGRDASNDVVLDSPRISRYHAQIERVGQRHRLTDLRSTNGTYINDTRAEGDVWLQPSDVIRIGSFRFVMGEDELGQYDESHGLHVDALDLNKWVRKDLNILQDISLTFKPREFIAVVGQSGGGKSTLVDAIAGYRPATQGVVLVNGTNIYSNFDVIQNEIGYVPQRDIIHYELSVYEALTYAARLRMPSDTSKDERHQRIMQVLEDLDLVERKDLPINRLSGGQIKRVSIGVELLTKPGLFFLDEPTSGLDPGTETSFMHLMRRLADQGRTIILVTHATKNVMLADKVVFLARGGYVAWFGPPEEALAYFDQYRSEREQRAHEMEFDQIYAILDDPSKGKAEEWAERYMAHPAYQKYIVEPLQPARTASAKSAEVKQRGKVSRSKSRPRVSGFRQFTILSARNFKILSRDRTSLILMLLVPVLVASLDFFLAMAMGRQLYDFYLGDAATASVTIFLLAINGLLVGGFSQMREFVKEADVYKRERLVNLKIFPYVASKAWVALLLSFYGAVVFTTIRFLAFDVPGGALIIGLYYVSIVLAILAGSMSGLMASAISKSPAVAPLLMILLIIPQIILSGSLAPLPENVTAIASTRWAFQDFTGLTGMGSDVASDPCWQLSEEERDLMSLEQKTAFGCKCMGLAVFDPNSCNFPGIGEFYVAEIDLPAPVEPAELGPEPPEPVIPDAPEPPADQNDQVAMVQYMNALNSYQDEVQLLQDQFRSEMDLYRSRADIYTAQIKDYQIERISYDAARIKAIGTAGALIQGNKEMMGWAFVNVRDVNNLITWITKTWLAQLIIIGVYFVLILGFIKRKDASA